MFDGSSYQNELRRRLQVVRQLLDAAHPAAEAPPPIDISREVRGLAIVLVFASYENLLKTVCRGLLEAAAATRVGNRRLRSGFRLFAVYPHLQALGMLPAARIWEDRGLQLMDAVGSSRKCTVAVDVFPADGSFMKCSQVRVFCQLFDLGDPGPILKDVWSRLDTIVSQRNQIAHGQLTPEDVGRGYTIQESRTLVDSWEKRWCEFVAHVAARSATRDFFREPR